MSYLFSAESLIRVMTFILTINIARRYGPTDFGIYSLALSISSLFDLICTLGIGTIFIQRVARNLESLQKELSIFLPLRLLLSLTSLIISSLFILVMNKNLETSLSLFLATLYANLLAIATFTWICFDAKQKMQYSAILKIIEFTAIFIIGMYFIYINSPIHNIFWGYLVGIIISIITTIPFLKREHINFFSIKIRPEQWKNIIAEGWPLTLSGAFIYIYNYLDTIIISFSKGESMVGIYQISYKIIGTLFIIPTLINQAYLPSLIQASDHPKHLNEIFNESLKNIFFWGIPISIGGFLLAERIIIFVYGNDFIMGTNTFKILIWNCVIYFFSYTVTNLLYATRQQRKTIGVFFAGALFNTVSNIYIIPLYGIEGAAATTIIAELIVLVGMTVIAHSSTKIKLFASSWQSIASSAVMAVFIIFFKIDNLILTVTGGALIYFGTYFALKQIFKITNNHIAKVRKILLTEQPRNE